MDFCKYGDFSVSGELEKRLSLSFSRMISDHYDPDRFLDEKFVMDADWPGDTEGRLLLALVMLSKALGKDVCAAKKLFDKILSLMNEDGYLGRIIDENNINEQSLSGNSWLMRGLCEYYEWTKSPDALSAISKMASGLFLKTKDRYYHYPMDSNMRLQNTGAESGSLTGESTNGWLPSTDIGCAFIMLDGVSHAYRILKTDALYALLSEMIHMFSKTDLKKCAFQTHASLSCARGILRAALETGREDWKSEAIRQFDFYIQNGITENYANHNWYTRPEWTEPCAIHDSFILATEIWRLTKNAAYLSLAHKILYNALYRSQRANGGFGCDNCAGEDGRMLFNKTYEAWWCCTMRGGEGLACVAKNIALEEDGVIYIPFYHPGCACLSGAEIKIESNYPYSGSAAISVFTQNGEKKTLALYKGENTRAFSVKNASVLKEENSFVYVEAQPGAKIEIAFELTLAKIPSRDIPGASLITYGSLILGHETESEIACPDVSALTLSDEEKAVFKTACGRTLTPLTHITFTSEEHIASSSIQIVF